MRVTHVLCLLTALFSVPAVAADVDAKQEAQKIASAYAENFNKQNAAGIAALYANGGMAVNPTGLHTDIAQIYEGAFKAGFNHNEITVDQARPLATDTLMSMGEYHITGKSQPGAPIEVEGHLDVELTFARAALGKFGCSRPSPGKRPLRRISVSSCKDNPLPKEVAIVSDFLSFTAAVFPHVQSSS